MAKSSQGIETYHEGKCAKRNGGSRCTCDPSYRAQVWDPQLGKARRSERFPKLQQAVNWRIETLAAKKSQTLAPVSSPKLADLADRVFEAIDAGVVTSRTGARFKPSTARTYRIYFDKYIRDGLGNCRITDLRRSHIQHLIDDIGPRKAGSTVKNSLMPLRLIFRYAEERDLVIVNPLIGLKLPAKDERPTKVISPKQAKELLSILAGTDRAIFATALFAGLRLGELRALRWKHVDLEKGLIRVKRSWDPRAGDIPPKSKAGVRAVPLISDLRSQLIGIRSPTASQDDFVFGNGSARPFGPQSLYSRLDKSCAGSSLAGVRLHECRHAYASYMIEAEINIKQLSTYMGHSSILITLDRYGHLLPGNERKAAERFENYLSMV